MLGWNLLYRVSLCLPSGGWYVTLLLKKCRLLVLFVAVITLAFVPGLYGTNGVTPVKAELKLTSKTPQQCLKTKYTWLCLVPQFFGIDSQRALDLVALLGVMVSAVA